MAQLGKQRDIGSFVVSEEAVRVLDDLFNELDVSTNTTDWQEHLRLKLAALNKCLPEMRRIARTDLRLR
jgi:hypothetical protein